MVSLDEMKLMLDEIAEEFPPELFRSLNGGIILLPEEKRNPWVKRGGLFTLGSYTSGGSMGRYITIYYGSFMRVFGHFDKTMLKKRLAKTLKHEFTHHLESLAGERGLAVRDARFIEDYLRRNK